MAIIKNNINEVWKVVLQEQREARKAREQKISEVDLQSYEEIKNPKQKVKDISKFLED